MEGDYITGIYGIITKDSLNYDGNLLDEFHKESNSSYLIDEIKYKNANFGRHSLNKFELDKTFGLHDHTLIVNDGIIFNLKDLLLNNQESTIGNLFLKLYGKNGWSFVKDLRGNFSGFIYDSDIDKLTVFTDHLASKPVYYFYDNKSNTLIFASELKVVAKGMEKLGFNCHLDMAGSYCLLTAGYMLGDLTLIEEIKKLPPGNILVYENGKIELKKYHEMSSTPYIEDSEDKIIEELDKRFEKAVRLEYEKDLEYGYSHIATLSGGLDCRTNVAYAKKLNFNDITCFTFSQSGYLDEKIAKEICSDKHFEFIFYSLDNGDYLMKNIDEIINSNDGLIFYLGSAHLYNCLKKISFNEYGLVHTGVLGGGALGAYLQNKTHQSIDDKILNKVTYSNKLLPKLSSLVDLNLFNYENDELFSFYERGVNGIFNGYRIIEQFTEYSSPALYIEFLEYAMKIHPKYRYKEDIYLKWISKYTPEFAKYKWEKYDLAPIYPIFFLDLFKKLKAPMRLIRRIIGSNQKHSSMNPTEYWWETNKKLQEYVSNSFAENISILENYPDLFNDCNYLFDKGSLIEKTQVITLLKAVNMLDISPISNDDILKKT